MAAAFDDIVALYTRHGWVLRRLLLTKETARQTGPAPAGISVTESDIDAAWFSRPQAQGEYAWEIRYLGPTPFAFVEHLDDSAPDFEHRLRTAEDRLRTVIASKKRGH
jgi:hypothetical protein